MENNSLKIALVSPKLKVADTSFNVDEIIKTYKEAAANDCEITVYPELAITGVSCGDLFFQKQLYKSSIREIKRIIEISKEVESTIIFGSYLEIDSEYYSCSFIVEGGALMGIVPKMNTKGCDGIDFSRWFTSGTELGELDVLHTELADLPVAFGEIVFEDSGFGLDILVKNGQDLFFDNSTPDEFSEDESEVCEEDKNPILTINLASDTTQTGTMHNRIEYFGKMSEQNKCAYAYVSPGVYESTTDYVFSGQSFVVSNGRTISKNKGFERKSIITYGVIDTSELKVLDDERLNKFSYGEYHSGLIQPNNNPLPFIPQNKENLNRICSDAFAIQSNALATRLEHVKAEKALIGVSGGLDSTLALLVTVEAFSLLGKDIKDIMTITMPGFGTSDRTFSNAMSLMELLGTDMREISIVKSVTQHLKDIGHDINNRNKAYENAQARERTHILMDLANDVNGIVIGTGDLSEVALGWCTYGGDHLAMYGVNSSVPKTLMPYIIRWVADNKGEYTNDEKKLKETLISVIETPISPELLPADEKGEIAQKTEESVGPYELHDYFIYHTILNKMAPTELLDAAEKAFEKVYDRVTIKKWLRTFYYRFFSQQFKRNCSTEAPMVTQISLSPRGGFVMPSDAVVLEWINGLD